jgi:superfamily II DNA or RNA helicase
MIELFPDQQEALDKVLERYKGCPIGGRALVVAPTAWGKTVFFSALINALDFVKKGIPVLIIAHRDELLDQARDKFHMFDPTAIVGKVGGGRHEYGCPVTVASVDTISGEKHLEKIPSFKYGLVIIDECHHSPAPKYQKVLNVLKEAFQLGVTATDERLDGKSLEPIFGKALFRMPIVDAIAKKRLSDVKAVAIRTEVDLNDIESSKNAEGVTDFNQTELNLAVNTPARNRRIVEAYQEHCPNERAICFAVTVAHASAISDAFNEAGISSVCVTGETPIEERKQIYTAFDKGEILVLTNVMVLTEGFDAPKIKGILMARPTQSRALYLQCVGRGLRKSPGKTHCIILDLTDNCDKYRLKPQSLRKAIKDVQEGETILEALEREKLENEERQVQVRKLKEKRLKDIHIDLFETLEWKELPNGVYLLEIGPERHKIALSPSKSNPELYYVQLKRAPYNSPTDKAQKLIDSPMPIDWAQQEAEKCARKIMAEPRGIALVDPSSPWRSKPISEKQKGMLKLYRIPVTEGMTSGQASDLIDAHKQEIEKRKAAKQARKAAKAIEV